MTNRLIVTFKSAVFSLILLMPLVAESEVYRLPAAGDDLIGRIRYATAGDEDTLIDIARENSLGQEEIVMANPTVDRWLPKGGTRVLIPRQFILPDAPRAGIVLNIPEMRLYYFPGGAVSAAPKPAAAKLRPVANNGRTKTHIARKGESSRPAAPKQPFMPETTEPATVSSSSSRDVVTYPVSIGRMDWRTPLGATQVIQKVKDPEWHPPESIKKEHAKDGDILPDVVPAGPNNPLGQFAMKLGVAGYLIHGTDVDKAYGIGMRVTHGCIRMYPEDIAKLFPLVSVGTSVRLVNQPVKLGWLGDDLYMEVHQPLDEDRMSYDELRSIALSLIDKKTASRPVSINNGAVKKELEHPTGVPVLISGIASVSEPVERAEPAPKAETYTESSGFDAAPEAAPLPARDPLPSELPEPSASEPAYVPGTDELDDSDEGDEPPPGAGI
jgi:L,D-transpeptidase ErfK/SrfK